MEKININFIDELAIRVYNDVAEKQLTGLLIEGKPLIDGFEISKQIRGNLDKYLTVEEQTQLFLDIRSFDLKEILNSIELEVAVVLAGVKVSSAILNAVTEHSYLMPKFPSTDSAINNYNIKIDKDENRF